MAAYYHYYPWAKIELLRETSSFISMRKVKNLCNHQALSKTIEKDVCVHICEMDEHVCKHENDDRKVDVTFGMPLYSVN